MNIQFLASLIKANNRLVIPSLGVFLHKDNGTVVFSPFLNKDDGMLKSAICKRFDVSAVEAQQQIDDLCGSIKMGLASIGKFYIDTIGILVVNESGGVSLIEDNTSKKIVVEVEPLPEIPSIDPLLSRSAQQPVLPAQSPVLQTYGQQPMQQNPVPVPPNRNTATPIPQAAPIPIPANRNPAIQNVTQQMPQSVPRPIAPKPQPTWVPPMPNQGQTQPQNMRGNVQHSNGNQQHPIGQYSEQQKQVQFQTNTRPQNQVAQPRSSQNMQRPPVQGKPQGQNGRKPKAPAQKRPKGGKNNIDIWLIVAVVAAVLVVMLIVYGLIATDPANQVY